MASCGDASSWLTVVQCANRFFWFAISENLIAEARWTAPTSPTMLCWTRGGRDSLVVSWQGSSVNTGPAIAGNSLYWGSGYSLLGPAVGTRNSTLFAFTIDQWNRVKNSCSN